MLGSEESPSLHQIAVYIADQLIQKHCSLREVPKVSANIPDENYVLLGQKNCEKPPS